MLATRTVGLDFFRPSVIRVHELPVSPTKSPLRYAPALSFPQYVTAQQAIEALRQMQPEHDTIYYLFVTDYEEHLVGVVSLRNLVVAPPGSQLFEFMDRRIITLPYDASLEEQAHLMSETGLLALPVVDEDGRLVGAVDTNDMISAVKDETTEAMYHLAGIPAQEDMSRPVFQVAQERFLWLLLNMGGLALVAWSINVFAPTITHLVLLAALLPVIISLGRSASMQSLTLLVRSLSLGKIRLADVRRALSHEIAASILSGVVVGLVAGIGVWVWQDHIVLGIIAGLTSLATLLVGAVAGVLIPLLLKFLHLNPARGATAFASTITGLSGVWMFLQSCTLALHLGYL